VWCNTENTLPILWITFLNIIKPENEFIHVKNFPSKNFFLAGPFKKLLKQEAL
jgi:hypothetical protein